MTTNVITREFERLAQRNAELLHTDAGEGQSLTESEDLATEFEANLTRLEELKDLLEKGDRFNALQTWAATPERRGAAFAPEAPERAQDRARTTPGAALVANAEFKAFLDHIAPGGRLSDSTPVDSQHFDLAGVDVKNLVTGGSSSGGAFFETDHTGLYAGFVQPQLTVRDLVLQATTTEDVVEYVRATAHTNAAVEVGEAATAADAALTIDDDEIVVGVPSGLKPDSTFEWTKVLAAVKPIAAGAPITRRALLNAGQLLGIIEGQLLFDGAQRLNSQMLNGNGSGDNLRGVRQTSGILTQAFSNNAIETLRKAKTKVSSASTGSGKVPNAAVITPETAETIDLFRVGGSTTTDGQFLLNPYADKPQRVWGMFLVEDSGMTTAKSVVGWWRDAVLWDREQATVRFFEQHKDFAMRNLIQALMELWVAFGVLQPRSFCDASMAA